jgi:hypothetical protein
VPLAEGFRIIPFFESLRPQNRKDFHLSDELLDDNVRHCIVCLDDVGDDGYVYVRRSDWDETKPSYEPLRYCWLCWEVLMRVTAMLHSRMNEDCGCSQIDHMDISGGDVPDFIPPDLRRHFE